METETNRTARKRERERERERKYNQFINKLSRVLPNVCARSGYIQILPPACRRLPHIVLFSFAFYFRPSSQHPVFAYPPPLAPLACFVSVSRHRTGARHRWALHCAGVRRRWVLCCRWVAGVRCYRRRTMGALCCRRVLLCCWGVEVQYHWRRTMKALCRRRALLCASAWCRCRRMMRALCCRSAGERRCYVVARGCWHRMLVGSRSRS